MTIHDITMTKEFWEDYDKAPSTIRKRMDSLVDKITEAKACPNSMRRHGAKSTDLEIGYVSVTKGGHWRILFWDHSGLMILHRLLNHNDYNIYLRSLGKGK